MSIVTTYLCLAGAILTASDRHRCTRSIPKFFKADSERHIGNLFHRRFLAPLFSTTDDAHWDRVRGVVWVGDLAHNCGVLGLGKANPGRSRTFWNGAHHRRRGGHQCVFKIGGVGKGRGEPWWNGGVGMHSGKISVG